MAKTLLSFLGRGAYSPNGQRQEYRLAQYEFRSPSGERVWLSPPVKQFAHAVYRFHLEPGRDRFQSVVIVGTSGSMWDTLAESFGDSTPTSTWETLSEMVDKQTVTQEILDRYGNELTETIGCRLRLKLIPAATTTDGQAEILKTISDSIEGGDRVWLDVTHGYRHLPMLGLAAAMIAVSVHGAEIEEIGYGAADMAQKGIVPVVSLKWILNLLAVLNGISELSRRRQLRPLIDCFPSGAIRNSLEDASYKLAVMRIDEAAVAVRDCCNAIKNDRERLPVELGFVSHVLLERLSQFTRQQRNARGLTEMARLALDEDDFLRTSIYLAEAIDKAAEAELPGDNDLDRKLRNVRHWMAHAGRLNIDRRDEDVRAIVSNRNQLRQFLRAQVERLRDETST